MLKQRLLTAAIAIPVALLVIFFLPPWAFGLVTFIIVLVAAWELSRLLGTEQTKEKLVFCFVTFWLTLGAAMIPASNALVLGGLAALGACYYVVRHARGNNGQKYSQLVLGGIATVLLVATWIALATLRVHEQNGSAWVLFLFLIVWAADSAAYFAGKLWGKHLLAPRVSPKKTWEGVAGGVVAAVAVGALACWALAIEPDKRVPLLLLTGFTAAFSVIGDLFESLLKRCQGLKDSGNLFPGHGGLLDRIDGLMVAAPVFVLGLMLLGIA